MAGRVMFTDSQQQDLVAGAEQRAENLQQTAPRLMFGAQSVGAPSGVTAQPQHSFTERYMTAPFGRGVDRFQGLAALAIGDYDEWAAQQNEISEGVQLTREDQGIMREIAETDSALEAARLYASNPRLIAALAFESLGIFTPTLATAGAAAAVSGGAGAFLPAAIVGLGSGATEYLATIEQKAVEAGADPEDPETMNALMNDDQFMAGARDAAIKRGIPIAALDAMSVGLAGKLFRASAGSAARRMFAATGELGAQSLYGGSGEALAQLAEYGRVNAPGEIVSEAVGELGTGPVEIATAMLARREPASPSVEDLTRQQGAQIADDAAPPSTTPPVTPTPAPVNEIIDRLGLEGETQVAPGGLPNVVPQEQPESIQQLGAMVDNEDLQANVPEEPEPESTGDRVRKWSAAQERTDDDKRQVPLYQEPSKVTPDVQLKRDLIALKEELVEAGIMSDKYQAVDITTQTQDPDVIGLYYDGLVRAAEENASPEVAAAVSSILDETDAKVVHETILNLRSLLRFDSTSPTFGTELESPTQQWQRAKIEAEDVFKSKGAFGAYEKNERKAILMGFYRATKRLFEHKANISLGDAAKKLTAKEIANRVEKQPKYLQDAARLIGEASRMLFGPAEVSKAAYNKLDAASKGAMTRATKAAQRRETRFTQIAAERQDNAPPAAEPPPPLPRRKSEEVATGRTEKLKQDAALVQEAELAAEQRRMSGEVRSNAETDDRQTYAREAKSFQKQAQKPSDVTEGDKRQPGAKVLESRRVRPLADKASGVTPAPERRPLKEKTEKKAGPTQAAVAEQKDKEAAATRKKIKKQQAAQEKRRVERQRKAEKERLAKVPVRPSIIRSVPKLMKMLRLKPRQIVSNLPFFDGMIEGNIAAINQEPRLVANMIGQLSAEKRAEFYELIDQVLDAPVEYFPSMLDVTRETNRPVPFNPANPVAAQEPVGALRDFVDANVRNNKQVRKAVFQYAMSLRTLQNRGIEQGTIVLESPSSRRSYNAMLARESKNFLVQLRQIADHEAPMVTSRELLQLWRDSLPRKMWLRDLLDAFIASGVDTPLWFEYKLTNADGKVVAGQYAPRSREIRINNAYSPGQQLAAIIHEFFHALTNDRLNADPIFRAEIQNLLDAVNTYVAENPQRVRADQRYGLKNVEEFLAESRNSSFMNLLQQVTSPAQPTLTLLDRFLNLVRNAWARLTGGTPVPPVTVLDTIMSLQDEIIISAEDQQMFRAMRTDIPAGTMELSIEGGKKALTQADTTARTWASKIRDGIRAADMGWMDLSYMEYRFRNLVATAMAAAKLPGNPLTNVMEAVLATSALARGLQEKFQGVAEQMQALSTESRDRIAVAMEKITRAKLNPTELNKTNSPSYADQPWLFISSGRLAGEPRQPQLLQAAERAFLDLNRQERDALLAARDLMVETRDIRRKALLKHALERRFPEMELYFIEELAEAESNAKFIQIVDANKDALAEFDLDQIKILARNVFEQGEIQGTYFPLRRKGNYVVVIMDDNPEDAYFAAFDTEYEANEHKKQLVARGENEADINVTPFITKSGQSTALLDAARSLTAKITQDSLVKNDDNTLNAEDVEKMNDAVVRAMAEILSDRLLSSAQLKRENVPGAQPADMLRNVEDYVRSTISAVSMLDAAVTYDNSIRELGTLQSHTDVDPAARRIIAAIRNELLLRAAEVANDRDVVATDRILGGIGFYNYLGAPSYWMLNATQTAVVGVPVLAGIAGKSYIQSVQSMKRAYKTLHKATEGLGWKALEDEKALLDKFTPAQRRVIEQLFRDNVIQGTLSHEFNLISGSGNSTYSKVTGILTSVPEQIERWNRISMALGAMEAGVTDYQSIRDIVQASQFNYDAANRARFLKYAPKLLGGGARRFIAPMMMFKVFGVNMAQLVYRNLWDGLGLNKNISAEERKQALKIFGGLLGTHTAFGGVFGGLGLGMAQIVESTVNAMLDDDEEIDASRALEDFLIDHTNEYVARIVTRGLPAAVGVDMSASINLGNLLFMNRDTDWSQYGGVEQSVYALMGPVAQYAAGAIREGSQFMDGEASAADFLEKAVPLKMYRALSQAYRYGMEGLETTRGQQFLSPDDLNVGALTLTALGLRSATVAQRQERFYADRAMNRTLEAKKSALQREVAMATTATERSRLLGEVREWNARMRARRNYALIIRGSGIRSTRRAQQEVARRYAGGRFTEYNR